jgi:hypothetical protein
MSEQGEKKQTGKGILVIGIIAIVVVAVLIGIIIFLVVSQNKSAEKTEEKRQVLVTEDNVEEVLEDLVEQNEEMSPVAEGYYTVTMSTTWHFNSGSEAAEDSYVENVESNLNDVYFDIVMEEDESQVLYRSPVIPRGGVLKNITLDKRLDAGRHEAVCIYSLLDENQNPISEVRVSVHLDVEN